MGTGYTFLRVCYCVNVLGWVVLSVVRDWCLLYSIVGSGEYTVH